MRSGMKAKFAIGDEVEVVDDSFKYSLLTWGLPVKGTIRRVVSDGTYDIKAEGVTVTVTDVPESVLGLAGGVPTEKDTFDSQQEIWEHIIAGGKVVATASGNVYGLKDGSISCIEEKERINVTESPSFRLCELFTKYKEPVVPNWYDNIPPQGVLCRTSQQENSEVESYNIIYKYDEDTSYSFRTKKGGFRYAIPLTQEEASELIYKPTV